MVRWRDKFSIGALQLFMEKLPCVDKISQKFQKRFFALDQKRVMYYEKPTVSAGPFIENRLLSLLFLT